MHKKNKDSHDDSDSGGNKGKQEVRNTIFMMDWFFGLFFFIIGLALIVIFPRNSQNEQGWNSCTLRSALVERV